MLVLSGALTASLAGVGHGSVGAGIAGLVHLVADMTHLLCAAAWLGGLACLGLVLRRVVNEGDAESIDVVRTVLPRFSKMGYAAVAALLVTGCINMMVLVARPEALIATDYGRLLLVKIGLVVMMIAIAICNRLVLSPRVLDAESPGGSGESTIALYRSVAGGAGGRAARPRGGCRAWYAPSGAGTMNLSLSAATSVPMARGAGKQPKQEIRVQPSLPTSYVSTESKCTISGW